MLRKVAHRCLAHLKMLLQEPCRNATLNVMLTF
jgi:hypothetical protein